jgi:hypothetical protein
MNKIKELLEDIWFGISDIGFYVGIILRIVLASVIGSVLGVSIVIFTLKMLGKI